MKYQRLIILIGLLIGCSKKADVSPVPDQSPYVGSYQVRTTVTTLKAGLTPVTWQTGQSGRVSSGSDGDPTHLSLSDGINSPLSLTLTNLSNGGTYFILAPYISKTDSLASSTGLGYFSPTGFGFSRTIVSPGASFTQIETASGVKQSY